jgi:hypothetical protein
VASIEEQLSRDDWDPMPDDQLVGEIVAISVRVGKSEKPYPVLVVKDGDGAEHTVSCGMFADDVIAQRPKVGERVGVRFCGPKPRADGSGDYDKFVIAFERDDAAEPDWDHMAAARGTRMASPRKADASAPVHDPWDGGIPEPPDDDPF